jgi:hypothetical protein
MITIIPPAQRLNGNRYSFGRLGEITDKVTYRFEDIFSGLPGNPDDPKNTFDQGTVASLNRFHDKFFNTNLTDWEDDREFDNLGKDYDRYGDSWGSGHPAAKEPHKAHVQMAGMVCYWLYEAYKYGKIKDTDYADALLSVDVDNLGMTEYMYEQLAECFRDHGKWRQQAKANTTEATGAPQLPDDDVYRQLKIICAYSARTAGWLLMRMNLAAYRYVQNFANAGTIITTRSLTDVLPLFNNYKYLEGDHLGKHINQGPAMYFSQLAMVDIDGWGYDNIRDTEWNWGSASDMDAPMTAVSNYDWVIFFQATQTGDILSESEMGGDQAIFGSLSLIATYGLYLIYGTKLGKIGRSDKWKFLAREFDYDRKYKLVGTGSALEDPPPSPAASTPGYTGPVLYAKQTNAMWKIKLASTYPAQLASMIEKLAIPPEPPVTPDKPNKHKVDEWTGGSGGGGGGTPSSDNKGTIAVMVLLAVGVLGLLAYRKQSK